MSDILGFLQQTFLGSETQQQMEANPRPELTKQISEIRDFQNGDMREYNDFVHRFQGHLLPYTNKLTVQKILAFSHSGSVISVQSNTFWSVHCSNGIHNSRPSEGSQTAGSKQGYKNPPVPRRLFGQSHIPPNLSPTYQDLGSSLPEIRLGSKHGEIETETQADL